MTLLHSCKVILLLNKLITFEVYAKVHYVILVFMSRPYYQAALMPASGALIYFTITQTVLLTLGSRY